MAISNGLRFRILQRDDFTCRYCGAKAPDVKLEVDHIVPVSRGGNLRSDNLITACWSCNQGKKARELTEEQVARYSIPEPPKIVVLRPRKEPKVRPMREPRPAKVLLNVYSEGGSYLGKQWFGHVPVSETWTYLPDGRFIGEFICTNCGFHNTYEHDSCSCRRLQRERDRNGGYTDSELARWQEESVCDCYECDDCWERRPECIYCGGERLREHRICEECYEEYYGFPREASS